MSELRGYLVVNNFIDQDKFTELYALLADAAEDNGIELCIKKTGELLRIVGQNMAQRPDFVLFWDKDTVCARLIEKEGIPVFNSAEAIALCDNKAYTSLALYGVSGVRMPKTVISPKTFDAFGYCDTAFVHDAIRLLGLPVVIKECYGSYGHQVYLADTAQQAVGIVKNMGSREFIMQEFISSSAGRDVRINIVGGEVVASMLRHSVNGDFRSNISSGGVTEIYEPNEAMCDMALRATTALGLDFAGVDVLFGEDGPYICEVNSNPHFKSTLDCTGVDLSQYIMKYIKRRLCNTVG